jgi:hypothetical protein
MALRESHDESRSTKTRTRKNCWTKGIFLVGAEMVGGFRYERRYAVKDG